MPWYRQWSEGGGRGAIPPSAIPTGPAKQAALALEQMWKMASSDKGFNPKEYKEVQTKFESIAKPMEESSKAALETGRALRLLEKQVKSLGLAIEGTAATAVKDKLEQAKQILRPGARDLLRTSGGAVAEFASIQDAARLIDEARAGARPGAELASEYTAKFKAEAEGIRSKYRSSRLARRFGANNPVVKRMLDAENRAKDAASRGADTEAEMHQANAEAASEELQQIERGIYRSRFIRAGVIKGINRVAGAATDATSQIISADIQGGAQGAFGVAGGAFSAMRDMSAGMIVHNGVNPLTGALYGVGLLGAGAAQLGMAAYGRGAGVLDRASAARGRFLPQYEGVQSAEKASGIFYTPTSDQLLRHAFSRQEGYNPYNINFLYDSEKRKAAIAAGGSADFMQASGDPNAVRRGHEYNAATAARRALSLSTEEKTVLYEEDRRQAVQNLLVDRFGAGTGNVTIDDVGGFLSATGGRGVGTAFGTSTASTAFGNVNQEFMRAAHGASYAKARGLSVQSIGTLAGLEPRFGVTGVEKLPGLVGAYGFGFRGEGRDQFTNQIAGELASAGMQGATPDLEPTARYYQGAVEAGGNRERLAADYKASIGAGAGLASSLFAGARGFTKAHMLQRALVKGKTPEGAAKLLREGKGEFSYAESEKLSRKAAPRIFGFQELGKGLTDMDLAAKIASQDKGGTAIKDEPVTPQQLKVAEGDAAKAGAATKVERDITEEVKMDTVAAKFDTATGNFANAVQQFITGMFGSDSVY